MRAIPLLAACGITIISLTEKVNAFDANDYLGTVSDAISATEGNNANVFNAAAKIAAPISQAIDQSKNVMSVIDGSMRPNTAIGRIVGRAVGIYASEIAATPFVMVACRGGWQLCLIVNSGVALGAFVVSARMESEGGSMGEKYLPSTLDDMAGLGSSKTGNLAVGGTYKLVSEERETGNDQELIGICEESVPEKLSEYLKKLSGNVSAGSCSVVAIRDLGNDEATLENSCRMTANGIRVSLYQRYHAGRRDEFLYVELAMDITNVFPNGETYRNTSHDKWLYSKCTP